jgi:hypothetical protein
MLVSICFRRYLAEQVFNARCIADVQMVEPVARMVAQRAERVEIAGVGQFVKIDDAGVRFRNQISADRRTDKACTAGHYDAHKDTFELRDHVRHSDFLRKSLAA